MKELPSRKEIGYANLNLGPAAMSEKAKANRITKLCPACGNKFTCAPSTSKRKRFCNQECKNRGQSMGLYKPRLGTGMTKEKKRMAGIYFHYKARDLAKGIQIGYSLKQFRKRMNNGICIYCKSNNTLGLDRIDNSKGHTIDNTNVCCNICNMTRGNRFSVEQMKQLGKIISTFNL